MSSTCSASPVSILDLADMNTSTVIITPTSMIAAAAASESLFLRDIEFMVIFTLLDDRKNRF